jgi:two-component system, NtrC family, nitrogen regulation sensor histidine kinase GlnL
MGELAITPDEGKIVAAINVPLLVVDDNNIICFANDACEGFFGRSRGRIEQRNIETLLKFDDIRISQALLTKEGDLSGQDMQVHSATGPTNVDINITNFGTADKYRLILLSPRFLDRSIIADMRVSGQQQAMGAPAILGHEIKNPLAGIRGAAQLLARQNGPNGKALTDLIVTEVDRIARLLDQMQNLGGKQTSETVPANIHLLIERAIRSIRAANEFLPDFSINYDPSLPDVQIDPDAMVQILINLLQNAVDALGNQHEGVIGISTRYVMAGALREVETNARGVTSIKLPVEIAITDNGPGVPSHITNELFAPFVTTKRDGQGLGLAIVRKLVQQINSRIIFERDENARITAFKLMLPIAQSAGRKDVLE